MKIRINSINEAKINNVIVQIEGPKDKKHNVLSLAMEMSVKMEEIDALVGCLEGCSVRDHYWVKDEMGNYFPRYKNIGGQQLTGVHKNGVLAIGNEKLSNCRLTKAKFTPMPGDQARLTCLISVIEPKEEDLDKIVGYKGCSLPISFVGDMALFEDDEPTETQPDMLDVEPEGIAQEGFSDAELSELDNDEVEEPVDEVEAEEDLEDERDE